MTCKRVPIKPVEKRKGKTNVVIRKKQSSTQLRMLDCTLSTTILVDEHALIFSVFLSI